MLSTVHLVRHLPLLVARAADLGIATGRRTRTDPVLAVPVDHLPILPAGWTALDGRGIATVAQRFTAYSCDRGFEVHLHSTAGLDDDTTPGDPAVAGKAIARISIYGHRLGVTVLAGARFEARWSIGTLRHRLAAGPCTLGDFMELLLDLQWPPPCG